MAAFSFASLVIFAEQAWVSSGKRRSPNARDEDIEQVFAYCKNTGLFENNYVREIRDLNRLVEELFENNQDRFKNREEVFDLFASAVFTGDVLPVGKLIENTFGKGSFRRLGEGEYPRENATLPSS